MWKGCFWVWPNNVKKKREGLGLRRRQRWIPHGRTPVGLGSNKRGVCPTGERPWGLVQTKEGYAPRANARGAWLIKKRYIPHGRKFPILMLMFRVSNVKRVFLSLT
jgi:hypothetical protein